MTQSLLTIMERAKFTNTERAIFGLLAANANASVTRTELLTTMKGTASHTIDSHIMAIRRKLKSCSAAVHIKTIVGQGFLLQIGSS